MNKKSLGLKGRLFIPIDISHRISFHIFSKGVNILLGKKSPYDAPSGWKYTQITSRIGFWQRESSRG
jgi:hypothetical protein